MANTGKREQEQGRESGLPGGGKGRRDEVDQKHGLFPFSLPHPDSVDPEIRPRGSITRAPYDESGSSELPGLEGELEGEAAPNEGEEARERK